MNIDKLSQSSLEYMMTYGWAILIIVIVAALLYSFGIFSPSNSLQSSYITGFNPFISGGTSTSCASNGFVVNLVNIAGHTVVIKNATINYSSGMSVENVYASSVSPSEVQNNQPFIVVFKNVTCPSAGSNYNSHINIIYSYNSSSTRLNSTATGSVGGTAVTYINGSVLFSESGLPSGTLWSVIFNGVSKSSDASQITFYTSSLAADYNITSGNIFFTPESKNGTAGMYSNKNIFFNESTWHSSPITPISLGWMPCVNSTNFIYCIGGYPGTGFNGVNTVYLHKANQSSLLNFWLNVRNYPTTIRIGSAASLGGYVYYMSGYNGATYPKAGYYSKVLANGSLGQWYSIPYPMGTLLQSCTSSDGYIYCIGGRNFSTNKATNYSYVAKPQANGNITSWFTTKPYPAKIYAETCVASGSYVYCIGGNNYTNGYIANVSVAAIEVNGSLTSWIQTKQYPVGIASAGCFVQKDYIYCIGGNNKTSLTNTVYFSQIEANGSLIGWQSTKSYQIKASPSCVTVNGTDYCIDGFASPATQNDVTDQIFASDQFANGSLVNWSVLPEYTYPQSFRYMPCVNSSDVIYCLGGIPSSGYTGSNLVYMDKAPTNLSLQTWSGTSSLPQSVWDGGVVSFNDYIYYISGNDNGNWNKYGWYSHVQPNGSLSTWNSLAQFPMKALGTSCAYANDYIYCVGGRNATTDIGTNYTFYGKIQANGNITSWSYTKPYPISDNLQTCISHGIRIYCIGQYNVTGHGNSLGNYVYFGTVLANGSISNWTQTSSYPTSIMLNACLVSNGYVYCTTGSNTTTVLNSTYYAKILSDGQLSTWNIGPSYPQRMTTMWCAPLNNSIVCTGGSTLANQGSDFVAWI